MVVRNASSGPNITAGRTKTASPKAAQSTDRRLFIPFTSSLLNGSRPKHSVPVSMSSFTFQESAPMPPHNRSWHFMGAQR
jgi:hypothetical protein